MAITGLAPYLVYSVPTGEFRLHRFLVLVAIALAVAYWYRVLPKNPLSDVLFMALLAGVYISKNFAAIYISPIPGVVKDLGILGHLMLIRTAVMAILAIRGGVNVEWRFIPQAREWLVGLRWFAVLVPLCGAALWMEGTVKQRVQTHPGVETAGIALAEFAGILWVVALSEEFLFRGLSAAMDGAVDGEPGGGAGGGIDPFRQRASGVSRAVPELALRDSGGDIRTVLRDGVAGIAQYSGEYGDACAGGDALPRIFSMTPINGDSISDWLYNQR